MRNDLDSEARCPAWLEALVIAAIALVVYWVWAVAHGAPAPPIVGR